MMKDQLDKLEKRVEKVEEKVVKLEKADVKTEVLVEQLISSMKNLTNKMEAYFDRMNQVEKETSKNSDNRLWTQDLVMHVVKWGVIAVISSVFIYNVAKM